MSQTCSESSAAGIKTHICDLKLLLLTHLSVCVSLRLSFCHFNIMDERFKDNAPTAARMTSRQNEDIRV